MDHIIQSFVPAKDVPIVMNIDGERRVIGTATVDADGKASMVLHSDFEQNLGIFPKANYFSVGWQTPRPQNQNGSVSE